MNSKYKTQQKIPRGYKETKLGLIPDEWEICQFKKIMESHGLFTDGDWIESKDQSPSGDVRLIQLADIGDGIYLNRSQKFLTSNKASELKCTFLKTGDILIARMPDPLGRACIFPGDAKQCVTAVDICIVRPPQDINRQWLIHAINHSHFRNRAYALASGTTRSRVSRSSIGSIKILVPTKNEQKTIADILNEWDSIIAKTQKLILAKRKFKKALMQQLLTGKHRFKEFIKSEDDVETHFGPVPKDWPYVKIGEIANHISERNDNEDKMTVLSCTKYDGLVDSLKYFGKKVFSDDTSNYKVVKFHQFAYATNHIEEGSIGLLTHRKAGLVSPMYTVFETTEKVYPPFLYSLFKTELYRHIFQVNTSASINRRGSLRWNQFSKIRIALPGLNEQKKISSVLAHCDKEIEQLNQQLELLKQQKRGLMQKLLTGKIRVKI